MTERYHNLDTDGLEPTEEDEVLVQPGIVDDGASLADKTSPEEEEWTRRLLRMRELPEAGTFRFRNPHGES